MAVPNSKKDYIAELQSQIEQIDSGSGKNLRKRRLVFGFVLAATILALGAGLLLAKSEPAYAYDRYVSSEETGEANAMAPFEYLAYRDLFEVWNRLDLGNDVNVLLSGGKFCLRDNVLIAPDPENGFLCLAPQTDSAKILAEQSGSYLNLVDGALYFRDDNDRDIYRYDSKSEQISCIYSGNIGEVFVTNGKIYCVDFDADASLLVMDLDGGNPETLRTTPILTFAVCGETVVYLDTAQNLYTFHSGTGETRHLADHIERFFLFVRILAESDQTILSFTTTGKDAQQIYQSDDTSMRLIGVSNDTILLQESGQLLRLGRGEATVVDSSSVVLYSSAFLDTQGNLYTLAYADPAAPAQLIIVPATNGGQ